MYDDFVKTKPELKNKIEPLFLDVFLKIVYQHSSLLFLNPTNGYIITVQFLAVTTKVSYVTEFITLYTV